ncbi:MAG: PPC domain-containing DNA-binding protein [archaeon]
MKFRKLDGHYILRLERGERIAEALLNFLRQQDVSLGYFFGLGAVSQAELAHYNLDTRKYSSKVLDGPREIISLSGNITEMDGMPYIHPHISVSDSEMNCVGGHLKEATVAATCEIVVKVLDGRIGRKFSEEIGLNLLDF